MSRRFVTIQTAIMLLTSSFVFTQVDDLKDKLNNIEGEVNKIVVATDNGEFIFEGDEAQTLFDRMKSKKHNVFKWKTEDDDFTFDVDGENVMVFKSDKGDKHIIKKIIDGEDLMIIDHKDIDDIDIIENGKKIKVEVKEDDGDKKVTVTTEENGEEKIEIYEGDEAEEYLKNMKEEHDILIDVEVETDSDGERIWIHKSGVKAPEIEKNVRVEVVDGVKKVTVTTIEDGEEKVELYEGDEAEKFLQEEKGDKKRKKIIIKEHK